MTPADPARPLVLIADNNAGLARTLARLLEAEGYPPPLVETDSRRVAALYQTHAPDAVLLDVDFGAGAPDGFAVLEALAPLEHDGYLPVLVLTGDDDQAIRLRALRAGARDFVSKSADPAELRARLRNIVELRMLQRELRNQNARLEHRVHERTQALVDMQLEMARRLAAVAEYRDPETGAHIIRMSLNCRRLAEGLGLEDEVCNRLLRASPLHDIGKVAIPDSILLKTGKLTDEESTLMRTHTTIGARMLEGATAPVLVMAREIALTHHEKFDGTGYPAGLAGEAIPLAGRIAAVADVFDALTSTRTYKEAWTVTDSAEHIRIQRGRHFDPAVVDAFDRTLPALVEIREGLAGRHA